jgi:hypothetical protein
MKRGLVALDPQSPPPAERAARVDAVRDAARAAGVDVAFIYGDVARSDDIAWLTNLCIYWNEGVLAVPVDGEPAFLTKLSKRVQPWMRATSTLQDLRSGRDLAALVGDVGAGAPRVGIVDRDLWPAALVGDVEAALGGVGLIDLPDAVRQVRRTPSESDVTEIRAIGRTLAAALDAAAGRAPHDAVADVERALRRAGATDVQPASGRAADGSASLDVVVQRRTLWLRAARASGGPLADALNAGLAAAAARLTAGVRPSELAAVARPALSAGTSSRLTVTSHADLAVGDLRPLCGDGSGDEAVLAGEVVVLALEAWDDDGAVAAAADSYLVGASGLEPLTDTTTAGGDDGRVG